MLCLLVIGEELLKALFSHKTAEFDMIWAHIFQDFLHVAPICL